MKDRLDYDYFYGGESEQFSFYRIPRQLIVGLEFKYVSTDAKLLYGLMLDRMGLSARNGWYDEESRVFIYYPIEEIKGALNCGNDKAVKQGQGKPARIYVKRFTCKDIPPQVEDPPPPPPRSLHFGKTEVQTSENQSVIILTKIRLKGAIPIHLSVPRLMGWIGRLAERG
ncbi:replication initiator protein A [Acutalibacter muris]|uniref:replication initiator protein A n=1 Tax=Acutalibacter muris TaxID=1796620 RepID=UPI0020CBA163|nr:replication initiator protein A [Acutalibacter muris]